VAGAELVLMNIRDDEGHGADRDLSLALRRLDAAALVPEADPAREAVLMAAFDAAQRCRTASRAAQYWYMAGLATAAAILIAAASTFHGIRPGPQPPNEFVMVPGAVTLPAMESGSLVRMDVPVSMLPSLGVMPPAGRVATVKADLIVGQDGLTRAVRLVK
jgi:hypothetical protein